MKQLKKVICLFLALIICFIATGCNMSLYEEVVVDEKFVEGEPQIIQVESQVEKTADTEIEVWVEDGTGATNTSDKTPTEDNSQEDTDENIVSEDYKNKVNDLYFGYYGSYYDSYGFDNWGEQYYTSDHMNCVFAGVDALPTMKKYNTKVWINVHGIYSQYIQAQVTGTTTWQTAFDSLNQSVIDSGAEDACLGWYIDEPTNMAAMKDVSEYAQKYGRRFFICFTVNAVSPRSYGGYKGENSHTNRDFTQYLTDVAFDCYWSVEDNMQTFENMIEDLHNTCPEDAYVWYIPDTYDYWSTCDKSKNSILQLADGKIDDLYYLYEFLMAEKKPGGLLCFAGDFTSGTEKIYGLRQLVENSPEGAWQELIDECKKIGKEICTMKYEHN